MKLGSFCNWPRDQYVTASLSSDATSAAEHRHQLRALLDAGCAKRRSLLPLFRAFTANADLQGEYREMQGEHAQLWLKVVPPQELRMLLPDHVSREEPQTLQGSQSRKHLKPLLF